MKATTKKILRVIVGNGSVKQEAMPITILRVYSEYFGTILCRCPHHMFLNSRHIVVWKRRGGGESICKGCWWVGLGGVFQAGIRATACNFIIIKIEDVKTRGKAGYDAADELNKARYV